MGRNKLQVNIARLMALCLAVALLLPLVPAASAASGTCGSDVAWTLEGGVLTVFGTGSMEDYSEEVLAPWVHFADQITAVIVKQGVQSVGAFAFFRLEKLKTVTLPQSVKTVGQCAFYACKQLTMLNMIGVAEIGESAFEQCSALRSVRLPNTLRTLRSRAFYRCDSLLSITVPASVTEMESTVFGYCHQLRSANILANISKLPYWTFYGCYALETVRLQQNISDLGEAALDGTKVEKPEYTDKVPEISFSDTQTESKDDTTVTTDTQYIEDADAAVSTTVTTVTKGDEKTTSVQIDAIIETKNGWDAVENAVNENRYGSTAVQVDLWLKGDTTVSGKDLGRFFGEDVKLTVHTSQGAQWYIDGKQVAANDLAKEYDLSYTLRELTGPDEKQKEALSGHKGYTLTFNAALDFKVEVEIRLPLDYFRQSAVFFTPEKDGYQRRQAVMIDDAGLAHFYLGQVESGVQYLIGINVPQKVEQDNQNPVSDVIIPDSMKNEYPKLEQTEEITYIVTGVKSSLGLNIGQLTFFLIAGMIICAVVVGVAMRILYKRKLKSGYIPDMRYTDEV